MNTQTEEAAEKFADEYREYLPKEMVDRLKRIFIEAAELEIWQQSQLPEIEGKSLFTMEQMKEAAEKAGIESDKFYKMIHHLPTQSQLPEQEQTQEEEQDYLEEGRKFRAILKEIQTQEQEVKAVVNTPIQDISEAIGKIDAALKSREGKAVGDAEIEGWDMKHKPKIAEQIAAYVHEIDSLQETNRKLGDKIAEFQKQNDDYIAIIMEQERAKDLLVNRIEGMRKDTDMWVRREKLLEAEIAALQKKITELQNDFMQVQTNEQIARFDKEDKLNMGGVNP